MSFDRRRLRCGEPALVEHDEVQHVPDLGANGFLLELDAPVPLATMPCARCHAGESDLMMSLPTHVTDPRLRHARILLQSREQAARNGVGRTDD